MRRRRPPRRFSSTQEQIDLGLPALTVLFGLQTLRILIPSIVYAYGERPGVTSIHMGLYAFAVFLLGFLAAVPCRLLGPQRTLALTGGGLALLRLVEQLSPSASLDLVLSTVGAVLFILFLPVYLGHVRGRGPQATATYGVGLLLGLALDSGLHGVFGTYDMSWQQGSNARVVVLILVLAQLGLLAQALGRRPRTGSSDGPFLGTLPFLAVGPFLFLQALVFQNIARLTVLTGWLQPVAFGWIVLANAVAVVAAIEVVHQIRRSAWPAVLGGAVVLMVAAVYMQRAGLTGALLLFVGQIIAAVELVLILIGLGTGADRAGLWRTAGANGVGMILFVALAFAYYVGYDLKVPYDNAILLPIAAAILALCALGAAWLLPGNRPSSAPNWTPALAALALLVLPLGSWAAWREPQPTAGSGWPVRVMTYNLHQGFDADGWLGMEALARVIEQGNADIVALQEVSRGWVINASLDMLTWLSHRLGMPYLFGPTADPLWGNAILSRYPILEHSLAELPRGGVPLRRGYLWARVDVGGGETLLVIATHLHHVEEDSLVRQSQVAAIADFWAGRDRTVILGDMNAGPDAVETAIYRNAGLRDAFAEVGSGNGFTYRSDRLYTRIDYVWVSPDLTVSDLAIPRGRASDHLAVAATVGR